jgi:hypothetical protein
MTNHAVDRKKSQGCEKYALCNGLSPVKLPRGDQIWFSDSQADCEACLQKLKEQERREEHGEM